MNKLMQGLPTLSPVRLVTALSLAGLGLAAAALDAGARADALWLGLTLLGLVAAVGPLQLFPWLGVGLGLIAGVTYMTIPLGIKAAAAPGGPLGVLVLFALVGLLGELAGRRLVSSERALALGLRGLSRRANDGEPGASCIEASAGRTLAQELARARRYRFGLTLALLEIDDWQESLGRRGRASMLALVNDFSQRLRQTLRQQDELAYVGGGRFSLLLPHTDASGALATTERARDILRQLGERLLRVGVAEFPDDASTEEELISEAEAALAADTQVGSDALDKRQQVGLR